MPRVEYFIGGGMDKGDFLSNVLRPSGIMERVRDSREADVLEIKCLYRGHEDELHILIEIREKWWSGEYTSIRITGHSWGGQAAMNLVQALYKDGIPVDELITLDPVSMFPFGEVIAKKWVNIYIKPSLFDQSIGKIPVLGNLVNGFLTLPTLLTERGRSGGYIANVGGQLGDENGADNFEMDASVGHEDAKAMYDRAREEMKKARLNPRAIK